jgi:hypothetical protein
MPRSLVWIERPDFVGSDVTSAGVVSERVLRMNVAKTTVPLDLIHRLLD